MMAFLYQRSSIDIASADSEQDTFRARKRSSRRCKRAWATNKRPARPSPRPRTCSEQWCAKGSWSDPGLTLRSGEGARLDAETGLGVALPVRTVALLAHSAHVIRSREHLVRAAICRGAGRVTRVGPRLLRPLHRVGFLVLRPEPLDAAKQLRQPLRILGAAGPGTPF